MKVLAKIDSSELFDALTDLTERETKNGVENQYLGGLKKAKKLRK